MLKIRNLFIKIIKLMDFSFHKENFLTFGALLLSYLYIKISGVNEIAENTFFENIGLIPLIIAIILCFRVKKYKTFFNITANILILAILREFSYGRVFFDSYAGIPSGFHLWLFYTHRYLIHIILGLYVACLALYSILNKIWIDIFNILKRTKIPFWTFLFTFIAIIIQIYYEILDNSLVEETAEMVVYCLVWAIVVIYIKKLKI